MNIVAIVQARVNSTRLPNKVLRLINGVPLIELLLLRLNKSSSISSILLATSGDESNKPLLDHVSKLGFATFQGSENDVLKRYYDAAVMSNADVIIRITGDCPLIDPSLVDECIKAFLLAGVDYLSNSNPPSFPDGMDVEVFTFDALTRAHHSALSSFDREHVTSFIRESTSFKTQVFSNHVNYSHLRLTVDEQVDLDVITSIFSHFHPNTFFGWNEIVSLYSSEPSIFSPNLGIARNEGSELGSGQKLWKRAKSLIPGGNMLLSKRAEMFLPNLWPSYFSKAKGCKVWDLDGNEFIDMSIMGIGTNTLGYGNLEVDDAVRSVIDKGNMSTFNCPEEVYLAQKLIDLHPWADMVRLARSGGEANSIAIRIARAATKKDKVAICGYHGWHDWYLSANLGSIETLDGHLLPGLQPNGVPRDLQGTTLPFKYNDIEGLRSLVDNHQIGTIKMEVSRNEGPKDNFLEEVRLLATSKGIVLIFDECTSGFRETFGGLHKKYGVEPDMAMFGKALGNGYAITAVIGKKEIMEAAQNTFISSTFWTERIGPSAALKTLEIMERTNSWAKITDTGNEVKANFKNLADRHQLRISQWGLPALTGYTFLSNSALAYKTYITQEMMKNGFLASNSVYVCTEHTPEIVKGYFEALDPIFKTIKECEDGGRDIATLLKGPICHDSFKRLN